MAGVIRAAEVKYIMVSHSAEGFLDSFSQSEYVFIRHSASDTARNDAWLYGHHAPAGFSSQVRGLLASGFWLLEEASALILGSDTSKN